MVYLYTKKPGKVPRCGGCPKKLQGVSRYLEGVTQKHEHGFYFQLKRIISYKGSISVSDQLCTHPSPNQQPSTDNNCGLMVKGGVGVQFPQMLVLTPDKQT